MVMVTGPASPTTPRTMRNFINLQQNKYRTLIINKLDVFYNFEPKKRRVKTLNIYVTFIVQTRFNNFRN